MKKSEIRVGGFYTAKVSNNLVTVRVDQINEHAQTVRGGALVDSTVYHVTNMATGRKTTFRSAMKFRGEVDPQKRMPGVDHTQPPAPGVMRGSILPPTAVVPQSAIKRELVEAVEGEKSSDPTPAVVTPAHVAAESPVGERVGVPTSAAKPIGLAAKLRPQTVDNSPHVIVEARAGTGKTTTLIEGLRRLKCTTCEGRGIVKYPQADTRPYENKRCPDCQRLTPSPQQAAVWDAICQSPKESTVCFVAFNKSIADELKSRVPAGCEASTMHSMGFKVVRKAFGNVQVKEHRVGDIIAELMGRDSRDLQREKPMLVKAVKELVGLCKMNLTDVGLNPIQMLSELIGHYDIDMEGVDLTEVYDLVPRVLDRCKAVDRDRAIDYDDMIWLPIALGLPVTKYDILLVDEAQDLNRCQQELAKRAGRRLILCGDPKQAIYGFAGADSESMQRMRDELGANADDTRGCIVLPLTVTRRCGKAIVREANKIVADFEAFETNPEGVISSARYPTDKDNRERPKPHYTDRCEEGNMVLCRVNAPLVSQCFRFLKAGKKANIQGRDVGQGLVSTVCKLAKKASKFTPGQVSVSTLVQHLSDWHHQETAKEQAKRNPSEARLIALEDRFDCICCFTEGCENVADVVRRIESVFTDDKKSPGIRLSSIHKAKGLEAKRVFLLQPDKATVPHPMAKTAWQVEQEWNLKYVAITRAIEELVFVS